MLRAVQQRRVHTKMSLNVSHRVVSPACIAERTELRLSKSGSSSSTQADYAAGRQHLIAEAPAWPPPCTCAVAW